MTRVNRKVWTDARFGLERIVDLGMALRRRAADHSRGVILYLHGLGESALCFERLLCDPRLDAWTHVAPDLLGYGKSSWPEQALSLEQHSASLDALLDRLQIDDVVLVGHSMGGVIGTDLVDRRQQRVRLFVNVEGNISPDDCSFSALIAAHSDDEWLSGGREELLGELHRSAVEEADDDETEASAVLHAYGASMHLCDPRVLYRNSVELVEQSAAMDLAQRLGQLEVPTVYVYGDPRGTGERSRQLLIDAGVDVEGISPAGHWPYLDQHEAFVDTMLRQLSRLDN